MCDLDAVGCIHNVRDRHSRSVAMQPLTIDQSPFDPVHALRLIEAQQDARILGEMVRAFECVGLPGLRGQRGKRPMRGDGIGVRGVERVDIGLAPGRKFQPQISQNSTRLHPKARSILQHLHQTQLPSSPVPSLARGPYR